MQYLMGCDDGGKLRLIDKDYHSPFRGKPSLRFAPVQVRRILLTELPSQLVQPLIRALDRVMRIGVGNRDYHYLSRFEIDGGKRISRHLSEAVSLVHCNRGIIL
jgi:hypothetical protein